MIKKLACAIVAVVVVTLAASPAQAKPVKQRAERAALCAAAFLVEIDPKTTELGERVTLKGRDLKCLNIILSVLEDVPDGYLYDASDEEIEKIVRDLTGRLKSGYRVSENDVFQADKRLGLLD